MVVLARRRLGFAERLMSIRNYLTVEAAFPDDTKWDDAGNNILPGGKCVGERVAELLETAGFRCTELVQHSFYGWGFEAMNDTLRVWCLIQDGGLDPGSWLFIFEPRQSFF